MFKQGFVLEMGLLSYRKPQWKDQVNKQAEETASLSDRVAVTPLSASL